MRICIAKIIRVPVKKEIWLWTIKESKKDEKEIFHKLPKMSKWIGGEVIPTFKQLER